MGIGAPLPPETVVLDLGPEHPSAHGTFRVRLRSDGDRIVHAEPIIGALHRGAEKLFESRDYRQLIMLAGRHNWLSSFHNELGVALVVERMLGLDVPERATWLRTALCELTRLIHHLSFIDAIIAHFDADVPAPGQPHRRALQYQLEALTGGRVHTMFNRVGGVLEDTPVGWIADTAAVIAHLVTDLPLISSRIEADSVRSATTGVGVLDRATAIAYGTSGPVARASGLDLDLRRDQPYVGYASLGDELRVVTAAAGDAWSRIACLVSEVEVSTTLAASALGRTASATGAVNVRLPKTLKLPEGAAYGWTESGSGANGYYLVSKADRTPWRMKLRSASFNNVQAIESMLRGARVDDVLPVLLSMFFIVGDIDK